MLVKLEFGDKLTELKPAIHMLEQGISGEFRGALDTWLVIVVVKVFFAHLQRSCLVNPSKSSAT